MTELISFPLSFMFYYLLVTLSVAALFIIIDKKKDFSNDTSNKLFLGLFLLGFILSGVLAYGFPVIHSVSEAQINGEVSQNIDYSIEDFGSEPRVRISRENNKVSKVVVFLKTLDLNSNEDYNNQKDSNYNRIAEAEFNELEDSFVFETEGLSFSLVDSPEYKVVSLNKSGKTISKDNFTISKNSYYHVGLRK